MASKFAMLVILAALFGAPALGEVIFEDDFMGDDSTNEWGEPINWQFIMYLSTVWVEEADDVPEYGPGVLYMGGPDGASTATIHMGLEVEATKTLTDCRFTALWVDRMIEGESDDGDFHLGIRCAEYDPETEEPSICYEVEYDGDDNDATNVVPERGPTSFHLMARGDGSLALDYATRDEVPRPVSNVWYWTSIQVVGQEVSAKVWRHGEDEPDWQLSAVVEDEAFILESGSVRIGAWSGNVHVAYVRVETVEEEPVSVDEWMVH